MTELEGAPTQPARGRGTVRRRALLAAIPTVMASTLAACGGSKPDTATRSAASPSKGAAKQQATGGEKVTLVYGLWDKAQVPAMKKIISEFERANPTISIQIALTPWDTYWTKLQTAATGGSAPDVFWMTLAYFQLYASNKMLVPLTKQIQAAGIDMAQYESSIANGYKWGSDTFGLPKDIDSIGLWYNKTMFAAENLKPPDSSWTWSDLLGAARRLTKDGVYGIAAYLSDQQTYYNTIPQAGGYVISPDGKHSGYDQTASIQGVQFWTDMINKEHVSPTLQQMTDTAAEQLFEAGKVAMYYDGSWAAEELKAVPYARKHADVAPIPKNKVRMTVSNGLANVIYAKTKHPDQAWKFVQFLGSKRAADIQANTGTVIPATKGSQQAWVKANPQFNAQVFVDELKHSYAFPVSVNTPAWRDYATTHFTDAWSGKTPTEQVCKDIANHMNDVLAKEPPRPS